MFKLCAVLGPKMPCYHLKWSIQKLKVVAKEEFESLEDIISFDPKFQTVDPAVEHKRRSKLLSYLDVLPFRTFWICYENIYKSDVNDKT